MVANNMSRLGLRKKACNRGTIWKYVSLILQLMQLEKIVVCACYAGTRTSSEHRRKLEMSGGYLLEYNNIIIT